MQCKGHTYGVRCRAVDGTKTFSNGVAAAQRKRVKQKRQSLRFWLHQNPRIQFKAERDFVILRPKL